jgi:hypothetical protein
MQPWQQVSFIRVVHRKAPCRCLLLVRGSPSIFMASSSPQNLPREGQERREVGKSGLRFQGSLSAGLTPRIGGMEERRQWYKLLL